MTRADQKKPVSLIEWLSKQKPARFPHDAGRPYPERIKSVAAYLDSEVHPHVVEGALVRDDGFLTDHGPGHIKTVIQRAQAILGNPPSREPYELYMLLMAAHFHDVGNIYGREGHEKKLEEIMEHVGLLAGEEMVEKGAIKRIAAAHGGMLNGNKDTISALPPTDPVLGHDIRYQAVAAVLRLADELADDSNRAARVLLDLHVIPKESEVFHEYAKALHNVQVIRDSGLIRLGYVFTRADGRRTFGKGAGDVYLLDEIHLRTLKMHCEREYCMRFMDRVARFDTIEVKIEVFADARNLEPCIPAIGYRLRNVGYPELAKRPIGEVCPEATITGEALSRMLSGGGE